MTTKLALTDLANGQANYLNGNETFAQLNQLVQAGVVDKDLATPPGSPADEALYIVAASPTGLWSGQAGKLAYWLSASGAWKFITPREGFLVHVNDEDIYYKYDGSAWGVFSGGGGGGMTNPMTTQGDIIVGGASGAPTRLGAGTAGYVLTSNGPGLAPSYQAGGGGGGAVSSVNGKTGAVQVLVPIIIACSDEVTALTSGTAKVTFRVPYAFTLTAVRASLTTAQASGAIFTVDINEGGTSILSTKLTIDNTEKTSTTAATAPVISDSSLADDAEITIDIDQVGDGTAKGLKVTLIGYQP